MVRKERDTVEKWAKGFLDLPRRNPTKEEQKMGIYALMLADKVNGDEELIRALENKEEGLASVLYLRVKYRHTYEIDPVVVMFLTYSEVMNSFGKMAMIANVLQYVAWKNGLKRITLKSLVQNGIFFYSMPTEGSWEKAWRLQKLSEEDRSVGFSSDNSLDYPECMESIREIKPKGKIS